MTDGKPRQFWNKKDDLINKADAHTLSGDILAHQSRFEEAVQEYDKALKIVPNNADVWVFKGITLSGGLGRDKDAMQCWERAKKLDPDVARAIEKVEEVDMTPIRVDPRLLCGRADGCRERIRRLMDTDEAGPS